MDMKIIEAAQKLSSLMRSEHKSIYLGVSPKDNYIELTLNKNDRLSSDFEMKEFEGFKVKIKYVEQKKPLVAWRSY